MAAADATGAGSAWAARTALCLADLHSSPTALARVDAFLAARARDLAVVLVAGDVTIPGHEAYAQDFVSVVARHGVPLLAVHGNNDREQAVAILRAAGVTIHRQQREVAGVRFAGLGGDGYAPHDTELGPGETVDLDLDGAILLTHVPPRQGVRIRYALEDAAAPRLNPGMSLAGAPRAHVCGHVHQLEGVAYLGPTKIVKVGAAMWNACALLNLDTLDARFLRIDSAAVRARRPATGRRVTR